MDKSWECTVCTLLNDIRATTCDICRSEKSASTVKIIVAEGSKNRDEVNSISCSSSDVKRSRTESSSDVDNTRRSKSCISSDVDSSISNCGSSDVINSISDSRKSSDASSSSNNGSNSNNNTSSDVNSDVSNSDNSSHDSSVSNSSNSGDSGSSNSISSGPSIASGSSNSSDVNNSDSSVINNNSSVISDVNNSDSSSKSSGSSGSNVNISISSSNSSNCNSSVGNSSDSSGGRSNDSDDSNDSSDVSISSSSSDGAFSSSGNGSGSSSSFLVNQTSAQDEKSTISSTSASSSFSSSSSVRRKVGASQWVCSNCTFENRVGTTMCEMCQTPNPDLPPQPKKPNWFSNLFGFDETNHATVKKWLVLEADDQKREGYYNLCSLANSRSFSVGRFSTPSIAELKRQVQDLPVSKSDKLKLRLMRADVAELQVDPSNALATFQVASQFNCLEAVAPTVTPEDGISAYSSDRTQGPACSISAGPATVFRNYFVPVTNAFGETQQGQSAENQINLLSDLCAALGNTQKEASKVEMKNFLGMPLSMNQKYFSMHGGYTLALNSDLEQLNAHLKAANRDALLQTVRVGLQQDVQVTSSDWGRKLLNNSRAATHESRLTISQVFTAAPAVAYSGNRPRALWEPFASLILEAEYEAVLLAAIANSFRHKGARGSNRVFLTLVGGGVFGNEIDWIIRSLAVVLRKYQQYQLDIRVVTFHPPEQELQYLVSHFSSWTKE